MTVRLGPPRGADTQTWSADEAADLRADTHEAHAEQGAGKTSGGSDKARPADLEPRCLPCFEADPGLLGTRAGAEETPEGVEEAVVVELHAEVELDAEGRPVVLNASGERTALKLELILDEAAEAEAVEPPPEGTEAAEAKDARRPVRAEKLVAPELVRARRAGESFGELVDAFRGLYGESPRAVDEEGGEGDLAQVGVAWLKPRVPRLADYLP